MDQRQTAITIGITLILMAVIAGFSFGYALPEFYQFDQTELLKEKIFSNHGLYMNMLVGILVILILDLLVSYYLFNYFKNDDRKIAFLSALIRIAYTVIFALATLYLIKNINQNELTNQTINANFNQFQLIWNGGLVIFGLHILLIGWLMKLHQRIPKILWVITLIAGFSYIAVHLIKLTSSNSSLIKYLEMGLALPMAAGELGLAIWLLLKGGKEITEVIK